MHDAPHCPEPATSGPSRWKRLFLYGLLAFLAVVTFSVAALDQVLLGYGLDIRDIPTGPPGHIAFANRDRLNILCLGVDYNHDSKAQLYTKWVRTDTIFVVSVDKEAKTFNILSIPRDTRVEIPGHGFDKINAAYACAENGALQLTKQTVEKFLGVPIDQTVVIKAYALERLVDAVGGVDIDVEKNMDYDDNWGDLHIHLKKGLQHLDGKRAVGYARFRKDEEGDRGRIRRQQQMVAALIRQARSIGTLSNLNAIARALRDNIATSLEFREMVDLALLYRGFDRKNMRTGRVDGDDAFHGGAYVIEADQREKDRLVASLLRGEAPGAPATVRLEILNGSDVVGAAARLGDYFKARGYQVVRVGNAGEVPSTRLVAHTRDPQIFAGITRLLGPLDVVQDPASDHTADVTIVLGRDWRSRSVSVPAGG